jgi:hypothetical protein
MWTAGLLEYNNKKEREWQAIDGAITKTPLCEAGTETNPTDQGNKI